MYGMVVKNKNKQTKTLMEKSSPVLGWYNLVLFLFLFFESLTEQPRHAWNSLCSPGWPQTPINPPVNLPKARITDSWIQVQEWV